MRSRNWSSDVFSSDRTFAVHAGNHRAAIEYVPRAYSVAGTNEKPAAHRIAAAFLPPPLFPLSRRTQYLHVVSSVVFVLFFACVHLQVYLFDVSGTTRTTPIPINCNNGSHNNSTEAANGGL